MDLKRATNVESGVSTSVVSELEVRGCVATRRQAVGRRGGGERSVAVGNRGSSEKLSSSRCSGSRVLAGERFLKSCSRSTGSPVSFGWNLPF
jgi:hypothetical protein